MNGEKIFITGGAGYLGSNLVARYNNNNGSRSSPQLIEINWN